ncbi:hypothetical protein LUX73_26650 [Actinomadura madurae]|nr:hypothetical protein [Actinomadura madurae]MCQ0007912.1 hypothetical protein [Actinomadura madurae]
MILARTGHTASARDAFALARSLFPAVDPKMFNADRSASFAAACQALGDAASAEQWFRHARASIALEPNPWQDHIAVIHPMLECGRDDLVRALLDDRAGHPDGGFFWEAEWLVYLLRTGRLDLAREFQALPGWDVPYEVLTVLAEQGRADLMETWGDHNWAIGDDLVELARRGTPPVRPPAPTGQDIRDLARDHARIQGMPHSRRQHPTAQLIESAAERGHISAVLDLLERLPERGDFNDRPSSAFGAIWLLHTGFNRPPVLARTRGRACYGSTVRRRRRSRPSRAGSASVPARRDTAMSTSGGSGRPWREGRRAAPAGMLPASSAPTPIPALTAAWTAWTLLLWKAIRHARPRRLRASRTGARHWHGWENITSGSGSVRGSSEAAAVQKRGTRRRHRTAFSLITDGSPNTRSTRP